MTLSPLGDSAVVLTLGEDVDEAMAARVRALAAEIDRHRPDGVVDVVPAFASVAVFFDFAHITGFAKLCADLEMLAGRAEAAVGAANGRRLEIPVVYGGEFGPDLQAVGSRAGLAPEDVVELHSGADYLVHAIGFVPGFPYLGGLPPRLATPRRETPRASVPAGSVGIGGAQTGIYPISTPGGWNIIGRTPLRLFDPNRVEPALFRAGDRVTFRRISEMEFHAAAGAPPDETREAERGSADSTTSAQADDAPAGGGRAGEIVSPTPAETSAITVVKAGMFTTVQDTGRPGHRAAGVPSGGAADAFALRVANLLVGNPETAAGLEFTLVGPELAFACDTIVAVGGGDFGDVPRWRPLRIRAGTTLTFGAARSGCRGYLAVAGGIDVAPVLGSRSTYVRGGFGGFGGRVLRDGDVLPVPMVARSFAGHWYIDERILPPYASAPVVRVVAGAQAGEFDGAWLRSEFTVTPNSDRMGVRLEGPGLRRIPRGELLSACVAPGTVQVPPDGDPIVLLADAQTIGGYPQMGHVISVDLPVVAQLRPGETLRFREVPLEEAHGLLVAYEHALAMLREGLAQKFG